jgi:hypothetical protein
MEIYWVKDCWKTNKKKSFSCHYKIQLAATCAIVVHGWLQHKIYYFLFYQKIEKLLAFSVENFTHAIKIIKTTFESN